MRLLRIACCAALLAAFAVPNAHADERNKKTFLTFSGAVQVPGTTLPAGTYMFKLADLETNRHVVQIFNKDGSKLIATFLTVPDYRLDAPKNNVVMFEERPRGMAQAVKAWWYVGDPTGDEFVYPKSQAFKIAKATHEPVLAMNDDNKSTSGDAMKGRKIGRVRETGDMTAENDTSSASHPADTSSAATGTSGTQANDRTTSAAPAKPARTLPRTASSLTLFELLAAAATAGAFGVHQLRRRIEAV
ncbi:MAG TPA: hypothetical protein VHU82_04775 [Vicinamibacterales bacterium]|jgi:hypothetical protein|nr:hypothetical protein [Vicinamibacterales bacterium]